jgi:hypothetical protein
MAAACRNVSMQAFLISAGLLWRALRPVAAAPLGRTEVTIRA